MRIPMKRYRGGSAPQFSKLWFYTPSENNFALAKLKKNVWPLSLGFGASVGVPDFYKWTYRDFHKLFWGIATKISEIAMKAHRNFLKISEGFPKNQWGFHKILNGILQNFFKAFSESCRFYQKHTKFLMTENSSEGFLLDPLEFSQKFTRSHYGIFTKSHGILPDSLGGVLFMPLWIFTNLCEKTREFPWNPHWKDLEDFVKVPVNTERVCDGGRTFQTLIL